jgi:hypothetical protein
MIMSYLIAAHNNEVSIKHATRGGLTVRVVLAFLLAGILMALLVQADLALPTA